jgi:hypothetical protein
MNKSMIHQPTQGQTTCVRRLTRLPTVPLIFALTVGLLAGCGGDTPTTPTDEDQTQPAAQPAPTATPTEQAQPAPAAPSAPAAATPSQPRPEDLLIPPPEQARFDADLSAAATEQWSVMGAERRISGTGGTWEGRDAQVYVYTTDQPFEDVHAYFMDAARQRGMMQENGEIEEDPLDALPPDVFASVAEAEGIPQRFVDAYRELYPELEGRTGRTAEFSFFDPRQSDGLRIVDVEIMQPYANLFAGELREQTGIQYSVVTMAPADDD